MPSTVLKTRSKGYMPDPTWKLQCSPVLMQSWIHPNLATMVPLLNRLLLSLSFPPKVIAFTHCVFHLGSPCLGHGSLSSLPVVFLFFFSSSNLQVFTWDLSNFMLRICTTWRWLLDERRVPGIPKVCGRPYQSLVLKVIMTKHFIAKQLVFLHHKIIFLVGDTWTNISYYLIPWAPTTHAFRLELLVPAHL